ncbi:MAG: sugar phosphate isomerase/epimerase family protein [Acidobacteriota bacterium]
MRRLSRRDFTSSLLATIAAPAIIQSAKNPPRLPLAFSTLGCPKWDWKTILGQAATLGYSGVELRGIQGEMDLTKRPEFSSTRIRASMRDVSALGLRITDLGASTKLHEFESAKRAAALDEARRFIDLAHQLKVPYVRVFGDKVLPEQTREATTKRIIAGLRELGEYSKGSGVAVIIESHGDFTDSSSLLRILESSRMTTTGLLWDAHHTFVLGKEEPAVTFKSLGSFVRHVHLKDSRPNEKGVQYVLTGAGVVPVKETVRVLLAGGYRGYYSFEWEKAWHDELEEPEVAFPHFVKMMREYLAAAGAKA